jgi:hypothetical protein
MRRKSTNTACTSQKAYLSYKDWRMSGIEAFHCVLTVPKGSAVSESVVLIDSFMLSAPFAVCQPNGPALLVSSVKDSPLA